MSESKPLWTQDQAIAFEAALEAINDVIAGYSEDIEHARNASPPLEQRIAWLKMRIMQARDVGDALATTDDASVAEVLREYSAIVRARDAAGPTAKAA